MAGEKGRRGEPRRPGELLLDGDFDRVVTNLDIEQQYLDKFSSAGVDVVLA